VVSGTNLRHVLKRIESFNENRKEHASLFTFPRVWCARGWLCMRWNRVRDSIRFRRTEGVLEANACQWWLYCGDPETEIRISQAEIRRQTADGNSF